jgi:hypothetical protein
MEVNPDSIVVSFFDGEYVIRALDHGVVAAGATYAEGRSAVPRRVGGLETPGSSLGSGAASARRLGPRTRAGARRIAAARTPLCRGHAGRAAPSE